MTTAARHLHPQTHGPAEGASGGSPPVLSYTGCEFDAWGWLFRLVDPPEGGGPSPLAQLKPAETKVLFCYFRHAIGRGIAYPSVALLCRETGLTDRAVQKARESLRSRGTLTPVETSPGRRANSYRLTSPHHPSFIIHHPPPTPNQRSPQPRTPVRSTPNARSPEAPKKQTNEAAAAPLFDPPPPADTAAAALLTRWGIPPREARGIVNCPATRPTLAQVRNVVANAARLRKQGRLKTAAGFIRSALKRGDYSLDDEIHRLRHQGRSRYRAAAARRLQRATRAPIPDTKNPSDIATWSAMSDDQRRDLRRRLVETLPPIGRAHAEKLLPHSPELIRLARERGVRP